MNVCPHCGAKLRESARFCPACMTSLVNKQVIPTPKYAPKRWLSATVAVFVLCAAVGAVWIMPPHPADAPVTTVMDTTVAPVTTEAQTTTAGEVPTSSSERLAVDGGTTALTTLAETFGEYPTDTTTVTHNTWRPTYDTTGRVPPFLLSTTTTRKVSTTQTTKTTTSTTKKTTKKTTTTKPAPTYPKAWDTSAVYYTEEGVAFEEVEWTYEPYWSDTFTYSPVISLSYAISKTCCYNIPISECIVVTGFDAPTANGYYRIPPVIDGKVVIGVNMQTTVAGACQFNDADIAPTVKRITFPPEMLFLGRYTINQCTNLERLYFDCNKLYMDPKALPQFDDYASLAQDLLRLYGNPDILNHYQEGWLRTYCEYYYNKEYGNYTPNYGALYNNVCHYYTEDLNYWTQLYPTQTRFFAMSTCPHCGATLRENARFCPACMTSLVNKRVIPTPKYAPKRWLSATVAVLVLCAAVGAVRMMPSRPGDIPVTAVMDTTTAPATTTEAQTTTAGEVPTSSSELLAVDGNTTTLTTLAETFGEHPTDTTTVTHNTWRPTYDTTGRVPPFLLSTTTRKVTTTQTTKTTTTTTKKTTAAPTTTTTTRPYWQDASPAAVTEDGLPIEEVTWTYEPMTSTTLWFTRCWDTDYPNASGSSVSRSATPSGVPLNQCIKVTGCIGTTSNGIYRVPATIDGKTVVAVDFGDSFANTATALTVKRIYLPPDLLRYSGGLENCTKLERLYITSPDCWFTPKHLPNCGSYWWGGVETFNLTIYVPTKFNPIYIQYYSPYVWLYACRGNVYDAEADHLSNKECQTLYGNSL